MASILETVKKLNKEYKTDKLIVKSNVLPHYDRLPTAALGMDYPLLVAFRLEEFVFIQGFSTLEKQQLHVVKWQHSKESSQIKLVSL